MSTPIDERVLPVGEFADQALVRRLFDHLPGRVPSIARAIAGVVVLVLIASGALLWSVPWLQTAAGVGEIIAPHPADRVQSIDALVAGKINLWYVHDGSRVKAGDPIVEIADVDPKLIERLEAERAAVASRLSAARLGSETAKLDYERQKTLFADGLSSRKESERAKIKYQEMLAKESSARAALNKVEVGLSRQSSQLVRAPRDGQIIHILAGNSSTFVKAGDSVATFAPSETVRAVQIYVSGLDAPLIGAGLKTRVMFEGWPAVQFSGWPQTSLGTFGGIVASVDASVSANGKFRVLISEDPEDPWPALKYLRLGGQSKAWIQLGTVRLGYELWRQLNQFPPQPPPVQASSK